VELACRPSYNLDNEGFYIEVIGFEEAGLERIKDFYEAFFQAVSWI